MSADGSSRPSALLKARVVVWCLTAAAALTAVAGLLQWQVAPSTGLVRTVYADPGFAGDPVSRELTADIDLAFLDDDPDLPRESFSVRWGGFWFLPEEQAIDLQADGDGRVEVLVDGGVVLQRDSTGGAETTRETFELPDGPHEFIVRYEALGDRADLTLLKSSAGETLRDFASTELFAERPDGNDHRLAVGVYWFVRLVAVFWLVPLVVLLGGPAGRRVTRAIAAPPTAGAFARRLYVPAFPALLVPVVLFLVGPHTIYTANRGEFSTVFTDIAWPWLLVAVGVGWVWLLGVGAVCAAVSERLSAFYAVVLLALGLLLWGQGNLWVGDYGVLDGRAVDWDGQAWRVPYELAAWIVIPVLAAVFWRRLSRLAPFVAQLFLVLQVAALVVGSPGLGVNQQVVWEEPPPALFQFSSEQNVIQVVLDEFQSDVFAEMLQRDPTSFREQFSGFTYFPNHLGAFPSTSLSMPAMLTGEEFRNDRPVPEFVRQTFANWSIFSSLSRAGYAIDATSIVPTPWFADWFVPQASPVNVDAARFSIRKPFVSRRDYRESTARQLLELSLSRHVPHVAKVALSENPSWFDRLFLLNNVRAEASERQHEASNSAAFFEQFIETMDLGRGRPVYKLLHLGVPHRPVVLDADCAFIDETRFSLESYLAQSRCAIDLVVSFLDRLRALGIYDSSLIVVLSDHGTDLRPPELSGTSDSLPMSRGASTPGLAAIIGSSRPLMLLKPPGRSEPLAISEAPTAHADLPGTMLALLGLAGAPDGESMFDIDEDVPRSRTYGMYDLDQRFPERYLDRLDVLAVEGRAVDASGWSLSRSILAPDLGLTAPELDVGTDAAAIHLGPGWSRKAEESIDGEDIAYVRSMSRRAVVFMSLPTDAAELVAHLSVRANGGLESIVVSLDGRPIERWASLGRDGYQDYSARIPADPSRPSVSTITFTFEAPETEGELVRLNRLAFRP